MSPSYHDNQRCQPPACREPHDGPRQRCGIRTHGLLLPGQADYQAFLIAVSSVMYVTDEPSYHDHGIMSTAGVSAIGSDVEPPPIMRIRLYTEQAPIPYGTGACVIATNECCSHAMPLIPRVRMLIPVTREYEHAIQFGTGLGAVGRCRRHNADGRQHDDR